MKNDFIVLEGIDASGKSTIGSLLADRLGYTFMELNQAELLQGIGLMWPHLQQDVRHLLNLTSLKHTSNRIVSILDNGGGVVCARYLNTVKIYNEEINLYKGIRNVLRPSFDELNLASPDVTIYLEVNEITRRARMSQRSRMSQGDHLMEIDLLRERIKISFRACADFVFDTTFKTPFEIVDDVISCIRPIKTGHKAPILETDDLLL